LWENTEVVKTRSSSPFSDIYFNGDDERLLTYYGLLNVKSNVIDSFPHLGQQRFTPEKLSGVNSEIYTLGRFSTGENGTGGPRNEAAYYRNGRYTLLEKENYVNSFATTPLLVVAR